MTLSCTFQSCLIQIVCVQGKIFPLIHSPHLFPYHAPRSKKCFAQVIMTYIVLYSTLLLARERQVLHSPLTMLTVDPILYHAPGILLIYSSMLS